VVPRTFDDSLRGAFLKSCLAGAVAIVVGVGARFAGLNTLGAGTALIATALSGGGYVVYGICAPRFRGRGTAGVVLIVLISAAVPAARTLWPGAPIVAGILREPGDEIPLPSPGERAVWVLVASSVGHDRPEWWAEYELGVGDASVTGDLGRVRGKRFTRGGVRVRAPGSELPGQYHRVRLERSISAVRLVRVAGEAPGGLEVSVFREPFAAWLAFACWGVVLLAVTVFDARWKLRGALGLAATIPIFISALTWRYVTPAAALDGTVRAVLAGTFVGTFAGCGVASIAGLAMRRPRSRR
jgi:hypothetical protein